MAIYKDGRASTGETLRIDALRTDGLTGVEDSLAYRVNEIERHLHNSNQCYGNDGADNFQRLSLDPFRITSGTGGAMGAELQIHDGTVVEGGDSTKKMDLGRIYIEAAQATNANYIVELWAGTGTFAAATKITELFYRVGTNLAEILPIVVPCRRTACNSKVWARCSCETDSQWLDFLLEIHSYAG
jgi:hypothetical protein